MTRSSRRSRRASSSDDPQVGKVVHVHLNLIQALLCKTFRRSERTGQHAEAVGIITSDSANTELLRYGLGIGSGSCQIERATTLKPNVGGARHLPPLLIPCVPRVIEPRPSASQRQLPGLRTPSSLHMNRGTDWACTPPVQDLSDAFTWSDARKNMIPASGYRPIGRTERRKDVGERIGELGTRIECRRLHSALRVAGSFVTIGNTAGQEDLTERAWRCEPDLVQTAAGRSLTAAMSVTHLSRKVMRATATPLTQ